LRTSCIAGRGASPVSDQGDIVAAERAERTILAAGWRQVGLDTEEGTFTAAETQDGQVLSSFRSMYSTGAPAGTPAFGLFTSATIPRPENRWVGSNRGGWSNPEYDRLVAALQSTLEPNERARAIVQAAAVLTEQLGTVSLYFNPSVLAFPAAVQGINLRAADADQTWDLYEWEIR
jgi:ABC-type transport system substrate-binding protein